MRVTVLAVPLICSVYSWPILADAPGFIFPGRTIRQKPHCNNLLRPYIYNLKRRNHSEFLDELPDNSRLELSF